MRPNSEPAPLTTVPIVSTEVAVEEAQYLVEAFRVFTLASDELSGAYAELRVQVAQLTGELAAANSALRQQYQEKAALTERLSLLLDALPAGVVVLDDAGTVVQINPAASNFLGGARVGTDWSEIYASALALGVTPGEFVGGGRHLAVDVTPLDSAGGRIVLLHDITETQDLKAHAERNQRLAAMGEMAAQLAHQLRTPLAAALLYAANLESLELSVVSRVAIAGKTVARLKHIEHLIQDMLLFARGEALGRESFAVIDLFTELTQSFEPLAQIRLVQFVVTDDSAGTLLVGNRKSLVSALTSLLENALQAVDGIADGRIELSARRGAGIVLLVVKDNGRGMDDLTIKRLFEPFFTTRGDGNGLGLAIARGVARAHGGGIDVISSPESGAEFILSLPCPKN